MEKAKLKKQLNSADVQKEVEELVELSTKSIEEFVGSEQLLKVDAVVQELSLAMDNYLKAEEVRRKRREKEKERMERLREEGKLMTKAERAKKEKQEAYLASLGGKAVSAVTRARTRGCGWWAAGGWVGG